MVSALFILVVLAVLGAAMATISARQQRASASELNAARAYQSARTGLEWGAFSVLVPAPPCGACCRLATGLLCCDEPDDER